MFPPSDKPVCKYDQKRVYGVARGEKAEISCEVDAYPPPDNFKWSFNNSASENIPVPEERFSKEKQSRTPLRNVLKYTPLSEMDYGTLICTASNVPGTQIEPCVYMIIAAGEWDLYRCISKTQEAPFKGFKIKKLPKHLFSKRKKKTKVRSNFNPLLGRELT